MNTNQLKQILQQDPNTRNLDSRVLPIDQLPKSPRFPFAYIVNTDPAKQNGEHWFALFKGSPREDLEFFDSYGFPIVLYPKRLQTFIKSLGTHYKEHNTMIQSPLSLTCGEHAAFFITQRCRGKSFEEIVSEYTENQNRNDQLVYRYIHSKYPGTEPTLFARVDFVNKLFNKMGNS